VTEELLSRPEKAASPTESTEHWTLVAHNDRVNRNWNDLIASAPANVARWYDYLRTQPTTRYPGRVFPLKGKKYSGAWECEVTSGDRVFYVPDVTSRKVVVYYAGKHPDPAPVPP